MKLIYWLFFGLVLPISDLLAQTATLSGRISDESGALVPGARVALTGPDGIAKTTVSGGDGSYAFTNLTPGTYAVQATAPELAAQPARVAIRPGPPQTLNLVLRVVAVAQQITVNANAGPLVSTEASANANALILRGDDLQALADDPEDLQADLQALAGPSAGPNGGSVFIDGFSGGELPQKDSIREIRINQNPFSPEYDKLGFGRIDVFTKPGAAKFQGNIFYNFANTALDSRNPFVSQKAPFQNNGFGGSLTGPLNKRTSFTLDAQQNYVYNGSVVNAVTLDPAHAYAHPLRERGEDAAEPDQVTPRVDYQLNGNNTLTVRYALTHSDIQDAGIGGFDLLSRGNHFESTNQTLQVIETAVLGAAVNETRFQYFRGANQTTPSTDAPEISVLGSFNDGGAQTGPAYRYSEQLRAAELHDHDSRRACLAFSECGRAGRLEDNISPANFERHVQPSRVVWRRSSTRITRRLPAPRASRSWFKLHRSNNTAARYCSSSLGTLPRRSACSAAALPSSRSTPGTRPSPGIRSTPARSWATTGGCCRISR